MSDRKILVCVYALVGRLNHVVYLDCWRRWRKWIQIKMNWRTLARECRYEWAVLKVGTIFRAWKVLANPHLRVPQEEEGGEMSEENMLYTKRKTKFGQVDPNEWVEQEVKELHNMLPGVQGVFAKLSEGGREQKHFVQLRKEIFVLLCRAR